ncbi:MAG TPA: hypothetical protein VE400_25495, partial [Mycobacterium sp.]|nr:hypothetical protein [Mycobacterium sp.]
MPFEANGALVGRADLIVTLWGSYFSYFWIMVVLMADNCAVPEVVNHAGPAITWCYSKGTTHVEDPDKQPIGQADVDDLAAQRGRPPRLLPSSDATVAYRLVYRRV